MRAFPQESFISTCGFVTYHHFGSRPEGSFDHTLAKAEHT